MGEAGPNARSVVDSLRLQQKYRAWTAANKGTREHAILTTCIGRLIHGGVGDRVQWTFIDHFISGKLNVEDYAQVGHEPEPAKFTLPPLVYAPLDDDELARFEAQMASSVGSLEPVNADEVDNLPSFEEILEEYEVARKEQSARASPALPVVPESPQEVNAEAVADAERRAADDVLAERLARAPRWQDTLRAVVSQLVARPESAAFREPVDSLLYCVKVADAGLSPMDLGSVLRGLLAGHYAHPCEAMRDVRAVWLGARHYYGKGHRNAVHAQTLAAQWVALLEEAVELETEAPRKRQRTQAGEDV